MISLKQIREASGGKEAYQKFFNSLLKKFGVSSPSELSGDKKKKFYDALDAGWDGDNEKPEKNERHSDPENLDPETTVDGDEDQADKAASHVTEALSKLIAKAGRGKLSPRDAIDIDYMGDRKDIKFDSTKWKINIKGSGDGQALVSGEKKKIIAWLTSDDYGMDDEDIEDLFPELLESRFPKALSVIREWSGDAETQRKKKRRFEAAEKIAHKQNEKMVMCEHCGKMHEEGACGESMEMGEASRYSRDLRGPAKETFQKALDIIRKEKIRGDRDQAAVVDKIKGVLNDRDVRQIKLALQYEGVVTEGVVNESEIHLSKLRAAKFAPKSKWSALKKKFNVTIDPSDPRWAQGKPADLHKFAVAMGMSKNDIKKTYNHITPEYKGASNISNKQREEVEEAMSMRSIGLKGASKRSRETGRKAKEGPALKGAKLGKSQPVLNRSQENEIHKIAYKHSGDMEKAMKEISKMRVWKGKGIQDHPYVMDVLKKANESVNEATVDRRTKGFKEALKRQEAAKIKREKAKAKKEKKKHQAELDARYDYDGEVDNVLAAANSVMFGKKLPEDAAANNAGDGGVDMAPNAGKKKKKETLLSRRSY